MIEFGVVILRFALSNLNMVTWAGSGLPCMRVFALTRLLRFWRERSVVPADNQRYERTKILHLDDISLSNRGRRCCIVDDANQKATKMVVSRYALSSRAFVCRHELNRLTLDSIAMSAPPTKISCYAAFDQPTMSRKDRDYEWKSIVRVASKLWSICASTNLCTAYAAMAATATGFSV